MESKIIEKQNLIEFIKLNFDLDLKFNDEHLLIEYKFKNHSINVTRKIHNLLTDYKYKLYCIAEHFDLKGDLRSIYHAISKCEHFVSKYRFKSRSFRNDTFTDDVIRILCKLKNLELKMIWIFLPEAVRKKYFKMYLKKEHYISSKIQELANELFP